MLNHSGLMSSSSTENMVARLYLLIARENRHLFHSVFAAVNPDYLPRGRSQKALRVFF